METTTTHQSQTTRQAETPDGDVRLGAWSTDEIEQLLIAQESVVARSRAIQAEGLAELDRRQVATGDGCRTLGEWTAARLDVSPETAARLVQLAHSRSERALVLDRLMSGAWSFDRTVESDRWVVAGATEADVIENGPRFDVSGLRSRVAHTRRITPSEEAAAFEGRYLVFQQSLDRTRGRFWGELPGADCERIEQTLSATADALPSLPDGTQPARSQRMADALVAHCTGQVPAERTTASREARMHAGRMSPGRRAIEPSLSGLREHSDAHLPSSFGSLSIFVDARAAHTAGGYMVGESVIDELLCDAHLEFIALHEGGTSDLGGRNTVTARQRRFIAYRDKACGADGCTSRHRLEVHHRLPRHLGGTNHDDNLVLLCWYHHHVVIHRHGFEITPDSPPGRLRFTKPATGAPQRE